MSDYWRQRRFVVTGGAGFLGRCLVAKLAERGATQVFVPRSRDYDLVDANGVVRMYDEFRPDVVIHLAAVVGGIGANRVAPSDDIVGNENR